MCRPNNSRVLSVYLLLICMTCQFEQLPRSNVTSAQEANTNTCMPGYYGRGCVSKCPSPCSTTCDSHGYCTACSRTGVRLPNCTVECSKGFYGLHCKNRCLECRNSACNPQSGECKKCRFPGLRLPVCTSPCLPGTFGVDCKNRCPLPCRQKCDLITGDCLECEHGQGPRCQVNCASEENLEACTRYCLGRCLTWCNSSNGMCSICIPGYKAPYCRDPCSDGRFGHNCAEKCSSRCKDGRCDPTTGVCYACNDGYVGERCNGQCIPGFYGAGCMSSCPPTCAGGLCNFTTGDCTRCNPGYTGPGCDLFCREGKFGKNCQLDCPVSCGGQCDPVSGECWRCLSGYVGIFCNESCKQGTHGLGCASLCAVGCSKRMCNHVSGACLACKGNFHGKLCDQSEEASPTPVTVLILIPLFIMCLLLTLIVSVICFWRKMRRNQTEKTDKQEGSQPTEQAVAMGSIRDKLEIPAPNQPESLGATSIRRGRNSLPSQGKDLQRLRLSVNPSNLFLPRTQQFPHTPGSDPVDLCLRSGLRSTRELARKEFDSQNRQKLDNQFAGVLKHRPQNIAAQPSPSTAIVPNRFGKSTGKLNWYSGKNLFNKESITDLSKVSKLPDRRGEQCCFSSERRICSMRGENSTSTPGKNEFGSDGNSGRETKITLFEHTECLSGKTTVSTAWSVNLPPYTPLVPSRQTPEMVIAQSRDSLFTGRMVNSADSLFGLTSADLSREMSNMSQRNNKLLEREQTSQTKCNLPCYQVAMNSIRSSTSHIFSDKKTALSHKTTLLPRRPSVHSLPETIFSTHLTCVTRPEHFHSDISNKVHSDGRLALTKADLKTCRTNLITKHEISINDQLGSDAGKPGSLSEGTKISRVSERSVVVSDSSKSEGMKISRVSDRSVVVSDNSKSARRTSHGDKSRTIDPQSGNVGHLYSSLTMDKRAQRGQCCVPGDETIPQSETNSWLNYEDMDDTAVCYDISLHTKVNDSRPTLSEVIHSEVLTKSLPLARNSFNSSSYHRVPDINPNITPPKQLFKTHILLDEDTHNDTSDALYFQNRSEQLTTMQCTDHEAAVDHAAQAHDDLCVHSVPTMLEASSRRTTRCCLPGDNASPKLIRCSTTRQVSPMYSHNTSQAANRLQPLPTPPPEGIKALRPIRKQSMSSSSSETQVPDPAMANEKHHS